VRSKWVATDQKITDELERFRNYHFGKGSLMADWDAAWRTWWLNGFHKCPPRLNQQPSLASRKRSSRSPRATTTSPSWTVKMGFCS
jgi:hypothetical protein